MNEITSKSLLFKHSSGFPRWTNEDTYKIFPFYLHSCLRKNYDEPFDLICEKCGYNIEGNSVVKCADFVFYDADTVKVFCCRDCRPDGLMKYDNQVYGYTKPVKLPEHLLDSLLHSTVWNYLYESDKYKLNKYYGKRITLEFLQKEFDSLFPSYSGRSGHGQNCILNQNGYITVTKSLYTGDDVDLSEEVNESRSIKHSRKSKGDPSDLILKITPSMIVSVIEEILNPQQLMLF